MPLTINPHVGANPIEDFQDWAGLQVEGLIYEINCLLDGCLLQCVLVMLLFCLLLSLSFFVLAGPAQGGSQAAQRAARPCGCQTGTHSNNIFENKKHKYTKYINPYGLNIYTKNLNI